MNTMNTFFSCFNRLPSLSLSRKPAQIDKKPSQNLHEFRTQVPQAFAEPDTGASVSPTEGNRSSLIAKNKSDPAPPMLSKSVVTLLNEAELESSTSKSMRHLEDAASKGSASAAGKLALHYHRGDFNPTGKPDYALAAVYYILALKFMYMIKTNKWDISLLLDIIAGLSEIYRKHMNKDEENDMWNAGVKAMIHIESALQEPSATKYLAQENFQKSKAIRIHINYCLGLSAEGDKKYTDSLEFFKTCQRIGECNFKTADKLIEKSYSKIESLQRYIPRVKPICVTCGHEPKELTEIWKLQICSKCQSAAACNRDCLKAHLETHVKIDKDENEDEA